MGNYISCILAGPPPDVHPRTINVILPGGEARCIDGSANAAELMLDVPGHFLVCSTSMKVGHRFSPLAADVDLEFGNVYVMLPMKRLKAAVTTEDMDGLLMAASKEIRSAEEKAVGSAAAQAAENPEFDEMAEEGSPAVEAEIQALKFKMSLSRSRRPRLETIAEESGC